MCDPPSLDKSKPLPYQRTFCECVVYDLECGTCMQKWGDAEKDLLPERVENVSWRNFNKCTKCGDSRPSGPECAPCWSNRRKHDKGSDQKFIIDTKQSSQGFKDKKEAQRRDYVRGEGKGRNYDGEASFALKAKEVDYKDQFVEGYFYPFDENLASVAPEESFETFKDKVAYVKNVFRKAVKKDAQGQFGVDEISLPQG